MRNPVSRARRISRSMSSAAPRRPAMAWRFRASSGSRRRISTSSPRLWAARATPWNCCGQPWGLIQGLQDGYRLKEVCFGDWEGLTIAELQSHYPDRVAARAGGKWDFIPPGDHAESYEFLSWRVGAWLNSIDRPTVCVSHGGVIRSIFRLVADTEKDEACQMHVPQDQVLKVDLHARRVDWL